MMTKDKIKDKIHSAKNWVLITPLSVDECLAILEKHNFEAHITRYSENQAQVSCVEHRGDRSIVRVYFKLSTVHDTTHITIVPHLSEIPRWLSDTRNRKREFIVATIIGFTVVLTAVMIQLPFVTGLSATGMRILFLVNGLFFALLVKLLKSAFDKIDSIYENDRSIKLRTSTIQRELANILSVESDEVRYDEQGRPYYLGSSEQQEKSQS